VASVVLGAGEGEALFGGRIVLKAALAQLTVTESWFATARAGAGPHFHRHHLDSFYVLEGELALRVQGDEHVLGPGACVSVPAGVVHAFRSTSPARFLNLHTPDAGFADNLRAIDRGEEGGFDSVDVEAGSGPPGASVTLVPAGEGERRAGSGHVATMRSERPELTLVELELERGFEVPMAPGGDGLAAFYVLDGEVRLALCGAEHALGSGAFAVVPPATSHVISSEAGPSRLLGIQVSPPVDGGTTAVGDTSP
jgi:quercetin dioxygenase-like cupin family protein